MGSAVFVSIMTITAQNSVVNYGQIAPMHGLNVTFAVMSVFTIILVFIAVFCVKE